jgi:hypothetical protein
MLKSVILSFIVVIIVTILIEFLAKFLTTTIDALHYFLIGTMFNVIRISVLGIVVGYLHDKLNGVLKKHAKGKVVITMA